MCCVLIDICHLLFEVVYFFFYCQVIFQCAGFSTFYLFVNGDICFFFPSWFKILWWTFVYKFLWTFVNEFLCGFSWVFAKEKFLCQGSGYQFFLIFLTLHHKNVISVLSIIWFVEEFDIQICKMYVCICIYWWESFYLIKELFIIPKNHTFLFWSGNVWRKWHTLVDSGVVE